MIARYDGVVKRHKWQEDDKGSREYVEINKLQGFAATGDPIFYNIAGTTDNDDFPGVRVKSKG